MMIKTGDGHIIARGNFLSPGKIFYGDAEFGLFAAGNYLFVMSGTDNRIYAQTHLAAPVDFA